MISYLNASSTYDQLSKYNYVVCINCPSINRQSRPTSRPIYKSAYIYFVSNINRLANTFLFINLNCFIIIIHKVVQIFHYYLEIYACYKKNFVLELKELFFM